MGFKPDLGDQLVFFSAFDAVDLVIRPVKIVPEMTCCMLSVTLNPTHSITHSLNYCTSSKCM